MRPMGAIRFPLLVRLKDSHEMVVYSSVSEMETRFEPIDVENSEYDVWDSAGMALRLSVEEGIEWLRIEPTGEPMHRELAEAIAEFARIGNVQVNSTALHGHDFAAALEQVASAIRTRRRAEGWWQKFRRRF